MKIITLQKNAVCAGCGKALKSGTNARYYGVDKIYCETPHNQQQTEQKIPGDVRTSPQSPMLVENDSRVSDGILSLTSVVDSMHTSTDLLAGVVGELNTVIHTLIVKLDTYLSALELFDIKEKREKTKTDSQRVEVDTSAKKSARR